MRQALADQERQQPSVGRPQVVQVGVAHRQVHRDGGPHRHHSASKGLLLIATLSATIQNELPTWAPARRGTVAPATPLTIGPSANSGPY
jgi:hypothetical protein